MAWTCDTCGAPTPIDDLLFVVLPRPSDPLELIPFHVACGDCAVGPEPLTRSGGVGTRSQLFADFEANGRALGFAWLTLPLDKE